MDAVTILAVGLLVLGVVGSVVPLLPGALLSLTGVYLHWWHTGYAEPALPVLVVFTLVGAFAVAVDYLAGAVAARAGGASLVTTAAAAVAGLILAVVAGPVGLLLGVGGTVFAVEFYRNQSTKRGLRAAGYATVGVLGSSLVQLLVSVAMLIGFLLVVVV